MEIAIVSDAISSIAHSAQSLGFSNLLLNRPHNVRSLHDTSPDQASQSPPPFHISAASPPPTRTLTRRRLRRSRRVKRKITADDGGDFSNEDVRFAFGGDGGNFNNGDGYFGGGGGDRGGKGWNFGGYGGTNWEEYPNNPIPDPAFDVVYEVLCWIAMSNCLHFALKKVVKLVADGFGDREKLQMRLTPVC
ncbi:hypothetical protein AAHA92_16401 [Salvia divinorum]|uniref:Uncharacterized protein n=1 Tax=Salvia divinorum TaxID=28513 RepID=A0ABD1GZC9_SALDI